MKGTEGLEIIVHHVPREANKEERKEKQVFRQKHRRNTTVSQRRKKHWSGSQTSPLFSSPICPWCPSKHHLAFSLSFLLQVFISFQEDKCNEKARPTFTVSLISSLSTLHGFLSYLVWNCPSPNQEVKMNYGVCKMCQISIPHCFLCLCKSAQGMDRCTCADSTALLGTALCFLSFKQSDNTHQWAFFSSERLWFSWPRTGAWSGVEKYYWKR